MNLAPARAVQTLGALAVLAVVALGGTYVVQEVRATPCDEPLVYGVGSIDTRFGLSEAELIDAMREAAAPWNNAAGKQIFVLGEEVTLPVSLVYDERQAAANLGDRIDTDQSRYDAKRREVERLIATHDAKVAQLDAQVAAFERAQEAYERDVSYWNERGGAPPSEYQKLESRRRSLERMQAEIARQTTAVNAEVDAINQAVAEANVFAEALNANVDTYNAFAGEEFDQGQYVRDGDGARITIYEFEDREYLVRALSHEFGHALGIEHTEAPQSLMYPYNSGKKLALSAEDIAALKEACRLE